MQHQDIHDFSSDRPISNFDEDLLGRSGFSKDLASAISNWHGKDSLVVALHGDWGSGKSSIKNMAVTELSKSDNVKADVIEFSPWQWAAQDKITESFFNEIASTIGLKDKSKEGKKLAKSFKKYGHYLNTGEILTSGLAKALPTLFVLTSIVGIGGNFLDETWVKTTSTAIISVLLLWAAALKWGRSLLNSLKNSAELSSKENKLSLADLRSELTKLLKDREKTTIVVMDDLDRLTSKQLRMVFQLVKANVEFPNVVFLLLFQRDLVEDKLNDGKQQGRDYLEKIIQVPFDIPQIEVSRLHQLLFKRLDVIIERDQSATSMFDNGYWGNVFYGSLKYYFDNLRNVYRFTSTLSFHFSLLKGKKAFEVNPVDLIAIECLRVFEPDVYKEISRSKETFTASRSSASERNIDETSTLINTIISKSDPSRTDVVRDLLKTLFPPIEWALGGMTYSHEFSKTWLKEMRICHPSNFDKYFQFSIPSGEASNSELREILELTSDGEKLAGHIRGLQERGIIDNTLSQFEAFLKKCHWIIALSLYRAY